MTFFDRMAAHQLVVPFTPSTYDAAFDTAATGYRPPLSAKKAEGIPIVYVCTHVVSEDIAKVSLHVEEDLGIDAQGRSLGKRKATDHPWYDALHHQANEYQTAIDFREMQTAFALNRGVGIAEKRRRRVGGTRRNELVPLHPDLVQPDRTDQGDLRWAYDDPTTHKRRYLLPDEVLVLWGPRRRSVISYLRELLANMQAAQDMQGQTWTRGPRHTGVITRPRDAPKWSDKARENFRSGVDEYMGEGERAGRPLLLEDGMTWENSGFSLDDSDFIEMANLDNALVCGAYRVPQHKAGLLERSTNNNIQQQATDYVVDCLLAWAVRWEQAIRSSLLVPPFLAEHNLRTLLRGDPKTAAETHAIYAALGFVTGNEVREDEGRNPLPELWEPRAPLNMDVPGVANASFQAPAIVVSEPDLPLLAAGPSPHHRALVWDAASRIVRKEGQAIAKLLAQHDGDELGQGIRDFYREHVAFVGKVLQIDDERATRYCLRRADAVVAAPDAIDEADVISELTDIALEPQGVAA